MNRPTNYAIFHCHSMLSTLTAGIDSVTRFEEYVSKAKECGMTAIGFSEHGNVFNHVHKKEFVESAGLKFIFAIEAYLTETISEKLRDNYHAVLIAENGDAVHEILELVTKSFNRDDGHFFYKPRITFDELFNTSKHILVSTACVASPLFSGTDEARNKYIEFLSNNKDRCYLEVQHHPHADTQKEYNTQLVELSKKYGIPLIAGTDTHCLNKQHEKARLILQKSKNITFSGEDNWDLSFKTIDELIDCYKEQGVLTEDEYYTAIENTNKMANRIERYVWDRSIKYPHIYDNPEEEFKKQINTGYKHNKYLHERYSKDEVKKRVNDEFEVYKKVGAIDFMLLETHVLNWERRNGIQRGYGRGSVSGSLIAYILGITEMDSLKFNLNFFRLKKRK